MKYFIYALECPVENSIKYVGISINPADRLIMHKRNNPNIRMKLWLDGLGAQGLSPKILILEETNEIDGINRERHWINIYSKTVLNIRKAIPYKKENVIISFNKLIGDYNKKLIDKSERLTQNKLAQEMYERGLFKTRRSAVNIIQRIKIGNAKAINYELAEFLMKKFEITFDELINL